MVWFLSLRILAPTVVAGPASPPRRPNPTVAPRSTLPTTNGHLPSSEPQIKPPETPAAESPRRSPPKASATLTPIKTSDKPIKFNVNKLGWIENQLVAPRLTELEFEPRPGAWRGIIVHQTMDEKKVAPTGLLKYWNTPGIKAGTHFLIDREGVVYQAVSFNWITYHTGSLRPRCRFATTDPVVRKGRPNKSDCNYAASLTPKQISDIEKEKKTVPDRYPSNYDSIGIEILSMRLSNDNDARAEPVNAKQNVALKWLVNSLLMTFPSISRDEIWRHPVIGYKSPHEASTARWE